MSVPLMKVRGYVSRSGDERGNLMMRLFDDNLENIGKVANIIKYGVNRGLETAYRLADPKVVKKALASYGRGLMNELEILYRNLEHSLDIANYFKAKETGYLDKDKETIGRIRGYFYRGYLKRGHDLLQYVVRKLDTLKGPSPDYEQLVKSAGKKTREGVDVSKAAMMMAIIGFFSLFLYSMGPSSTGQTIAFSGFNFYLIGIFTFITIAALYFIYKM